MNEQYKNPLMSEAIAEKIKSTGVVATLVLKDLKQAIPVAQALKQGGVDIIELTLRTPVAKEAAELIIKEVDGLTVGFGTAITIDQIKMASKIGVDFAVSPGCNPEILSVARNEGLSFAPGIMTPSDIEIALEHGCRMLKFFPAETSGGMKHLNSMAAPYKHLGLQFLPLGGINIQNANSYLESSLIAAIGGSWIASAQLIEQENWSQITKNAIEISNLIQNIRKIK